MEREIAETGVNNYCLEEEVSSSSDDSSSASSSMSEEDSSEGEQAEVTPGGGDGTLRAPSSTIAIRDGASGDGGRDQEHGGRTSEPAGGEEAPGEGTVTYRPVCEQTHHITEHP